MGNAKSTDSEKKKKGEKIKTIIRKDSPGIPRKDQTRLKDIFIIYIQTSLY